MPVTDIERDPLAGWLRRSGRLSHEALDRAEGLAAERGERLALILPRLGFMSEAELAQSLADATGLEIVTAAELLDEPLLRDTINPRFLRTAGIIPLADKPAALVVAMVDPTDHDAIAALAFAVGKPVEARIACVSDIEAAWDRLYATTENSAKRSAIEAASDDIERLKDLASEAPVIRLVNQIITRAAEARASDIHIETTSTGLRLRYRIDGVLQEMPAPAAGLGPALVSRIKVMAKLNIAERRLAQDGRIRLAVRGEDIDLRVSTTPSIHGEGVVLRILDVGAVSLDFESLGFESALLDRLTTILSRPHGILLVTGPTGSGKTTTLYAALRTLSTPDRKVLTIEDPVEYQIEGINQLQVRPQIGLTFATALRSFLRQDPDIMMIGEIRDLETAQIAVQAALTGHLILSTLHTNDAGSAVTRLLDMGIEDYLLTSTVNGILGQRLVRKLCAECARPYEALPDLVRRLELAELATPGQAINLFEPVGCAACNGSGYHGRTSIVEILVVSDAIRQLVLQRAEARQIQRQAIEEGMESMHVHGLRKALAGITSIEEVLRATSDL